MELKAIAMIELNSIAKGVAAANEMLKSADVALVMAQPICAGKYMALVSGDVDSVERAWEVGKEVAGEPENFWWMILLSPTYIPPCFRR